MEYECIFYKINYSVDVEHYSVFFPLKDWILVTNIAECHHGIKPNKLGTCRCLG